MSDEITILVVDDSEDDSFLLERALRKAGSNATLRFVGGGLDAINYLQGRGEFADRERFPFPRLMVLDIKMPGMDGFEVLKWLKGQGSLRKLPVLVWSSSNVQGDVDQALMLGASCFMTKPHDLAQFEAMAAAIDHFWLKVCTLPKLDEGEHF